MSSITNVPPHRRANPRTVCTPPGARTVNVGPSGNLYCDDSYFGPGRSRPEPSQLIDLDHGPLLPSVKEVRYDVQTHS